MFEAFPKLTRFSHDWLITEKLDGTNAQLLVLPTPEIPLALVDDFDLGGHRIDGMPWSVMAGSRNRFLSVKKDNHGFANWAFANRDAIIDLLGEGRHFGEWYGSGVSKRDYNLEKGDKRLALFNVKRWRNAELPPQVETVPLIAEGYLENPGQAALDALENLRQNGSNINKYNNPEGVVMYHAPSGVAFKKTFDYDEAGKWAEKIARR